MNPVGHITLRCRSDGGDDRERWHRFTHGRGLENVVTSPWGVRGAEMLGVDLATDVPCVHRTQKRVDDG